MKAIVFRAVIAIAGTNIEAGDSIVFDPGANRLCTLCQAVDPGLVLNQYELGALIPLSPAPSPEEMHRAVLRLQQPLPTPRPAKRPRAKPPSRRHKPLGDPA